MDKAEAYEIAAQWHDRNAAGCRDIADRKEQGDWQATLRYCEGQWSDERGFMIDQIQAIRKVRDGYADQAKFADIDCAVHFREFIRRIDAALAA